jgi:RHS repeat-associated protein
MGGTTWYLHGDNNALVFEKELKANGVTENRHYLQAAGITFALVTTRSGAGVSSTASDLSKRSAQVRYFHQDHLNSMAVITDEAGQVVERLAYDPWGKRRNANGLADKSDSLVGQTTDRGYTEHEHLDEVGLIHMNGRVYDPLIGRFMSADPFIQSPGNLQSYNRYAYVMNNPLAFTDPSGYFSLKKFFRAAVTIAVAYYTGQWISNSFMVGAANGFVATGATSTAFATGIGTQAAGLTLTGSAVAGAAGGFAAGFVGSALNGGNLRQDLSAGVLGGLTGALFGAAGHAGGYGEAGANSYARYAAHAGAGCVSSVAGGGSCGQGAASAVFGKFTTNAISGWGGDGTGAVIARGVATAVAGGVGSAIAGGKFANGAETAAYGYLFNELLNEGTRQGAMKRAGYEKTTYSDGTVCNTGSDLGCVVEKPSSNQKYSTNDCATAECRAGLLPAPSENRTQRQIDYGLCKLTCGVAGTPLTVTVNVLTGGGSVGSVLGFVSKTGMCAELVCTKPKD